MNNLLSYYYDITTNNIRKHNNNYFFVFKKNKYCLNALEEVNFNYFLNMMQNLKYNVYVHTLVLNKEKKYITFDGTKYYVLFKINITSDRIININDIILFNKYIFLYDYPNINKKMCIEKWSKKIDYFEFYFDSRDDVSNELKNIFYYIVGLGEVAIKYLSINNSINTGDTIICHKRIKYKYTLYDLYNPLNFIYDEKTRDVAEYIKSLFWNEKWSYNNIQVIISTVNYNENNFIFLISRLLFPTYFFDLFDEYFNNELEDIYIIKKFDKIKEYQTYIRNIIAIINTMKRLHMPSIDWL